jgi:hypothetical protein
MHDNDQGFSGYITNITWQSSIGIYSVHFATTFLSEHIKRKENYNLISDLYYCPSLLLSFWTLSIVRIYTNRKQNVSETGSVSETLCFLFVEIRTMDKVQKLSSNECYTPSSEPFRMYVIV